MKNPTVPDSSCSHAPAGHRSIEELVLLAQRGGQDAHVEDCAFCREQLDWLIMLEGAQEEWTGDRLETNPVPTRAAAVYRLAADDGRSEGQGMRLRRAWYLAGNSCILRVLEDVERRVLIGFIVQEAEHNARTIIRFSAIDHDFHLDATGMFEIGPADLAIETMDARVEYLDAR